MSRKGVASPSAVRALSGKVMKQSVTVGSRATAAVVLPEALAVVFPEALAAAAVVVPAALFKEDVMVVLETCAANPEEAIAENRKTVEVKRATLGAIIQRTLPAVVER